LVKKANSGQTELFKNGPKWFPIATNLQIDTKVKSLGLSKLKFTVPNFPCPQVSTTYQTKLTNLPFLVPCTLILIIQKDHKWLLWPLRSIWGVWQWSQWISHVPKPGDRHQNQVSRTFQTKLTNLVIFGYIWFSVPKWNRRARIENIVLSW